MPITPEQFRIVYPQLAEWVSRTLAAHAGRTRTVATAGFPRLSDYYSPSLLHRAKYVPVETCPKPPLNGWGLTQLAEFERMHPNGITYLDTYFVRAESASDEALHFHELIHVVQWDVLGAEGFAARYAEEVGKFGYWNSPLELMAYRAEDRFRRGEIFDAELLIRDQLGRIRPR